MPSRHYPFFLLLVAVAWLPFASTAQEINPLGDGARAVYAGGVLFRAQCATCHGADATGISSIDAPDLTQMWRERDYGDADVFAIIKNGIPGTIMPPHDFTDTETWMLVSFLRSVGVSGVEELPPGDGERGGELFAAHCAECHRVGRRGGVLGPDLSDILRRSTLAAIGSAIRDPGALVPPGFKTVEVIAGGQRLQGALKNEDAFSLQMISRDQKLRAFRKEQVTVRRLPGSLMPAFGQAQLGDADLLDILNYIQAISEDGQ